MATSYLLEVVTPERVVVKQEVEFTSVRSTEGSLGIMANHAPLVTTLDIGLLRFEKDGAADEMTLTGGFLEFAENKATILGNAAERPGDIDVSRAEAARQRAEKRIEEAKNGNAEIDLMRAELALKRALLRLSAGGRK
ncbi:MAG: F0F1 ATP synthase subunit epsilon [Heliobacteriaceae bacterium]|nr:F0F1 ATP synthase subunit epsilon [Heliobacteriaceae bacterium]